MGATGARFDLIGMDQRFAGRSTPLNCHWTAGWLPRGAGRSKASFDRDGAPDQEPGAPCAGRSGAMLPFAGTANAARDMDVIRGALGESRLSYLGYSYGTYLGAVYTQMFPGRAGRIVLDSAINPAHPGVAKGSNGPQREQALHAWARFAAQPRQPVPPGQHRQPRCWRPSTGSTAPRPAPAASRPVPRR